MLAGTTIVEFSALGPAPFAGRMLAELGARVIVIHRRDDDRSPAKAAISPLDRGKQSIALDLKSPTDRAIAYDLATKADAVIEGFRPGVMERLGLGPDDLMSQNPALVYGRMTGWGQTGPLAQVAGHDLNYISLSGALWFAGKTGDAPLTPPTQVGDIGGGAMYLIAGILAGLIRAGKTGIGTVVDAAIVDGSAHMMNLLMSLQATGDLSQERGQSLLDGPHWCQTYQCADGGYLSVQCLEPKFYNIFLTLMGLADSADFRAQYDRAAWPKLTQRLAQIFAEKPLAHWVSIFDGTDACVAPVLSPQAAQTHPHIAARDIWQDQDGITMAAPAPRFSGYDPKLGPTPIVDQDRGDILNWLTKNKAI